MSYLLKPIDFSGFVGYPHDISEDVIDNLPDYHNYGDASAHIRAFTQCIDEWCDPPIYEDVLMSLFVMTFCEEYAFNWFQDSEDNTFKTIQDLLHAFLERFGDDQDEIYNELVDDFMEKWKRKNLPDIETISSDIEIDTPPDPIEELKEIIMNMQYAHTKQLEAIEDQLEIMEARLVEDEACIEYLNPIELELHNEKDKEVYGEIPDESMDESVIYFEEVKEFEFESVEYLDNSSPHLLPRNQSF
jgi:hypothetical protein